MNSTNKKKSPVNRKKAFLSIFLMAALLITGAFAFLTSTDSKTNVFTIGNVKIELIEKFDGETYNGGVDPKTEGKVVEDIIPGQTIEKAPYVKNIGTNKAYIYVSVGIPVDDARNVYTKNGTYTSKNELSIPVKAYAIQEGYKSKTNAEEIWDAYFNELVYDIIDDNSKIELFELLHKNESLEYINGINSNEWKEIAIYKTENYNYYIYSYTTENGETLLANTQTANLFDAVKFNSNIGGKNPDDTLLTLNYLISNDSGSYEVIKSIEKEEGEEINELYSSNALAKTGYSLDWHVNSPEGEIATAAYKVNDDTNLYGVYTNLVDADSDEEYDGVQYLTYALGYNDDFGGLYAVAIGADSAHANYPDEPSTVVVPANISVTLTESGVVTTPNGTIKAFANNEVFDPSEFNDDYSDVDTEYLNFKNASPAGIFLLNAKANGMTLSLANSTLNGKMTIGTAYKIPVKMVTQAWKDMYADDEENDLLYSEYVALHNITKKLVLPDSIRNISFACPWFSEPVLKEVEIPMSCTVIDADAFMDQALLTEINLGYNVKKIRFGAFADCENLQEIIIPDNVKILEEETFGGCAALKSVSFGDELEEIGECAFYQCENLMDIAFPTNLKIIGNYAFYRCDELNEVNIPDSVKSIGKGAFGTCRKLTSVSLGSGISEIKENTFLGCDKLSNLTLGSGVQNIKSQAFQSCPALNELYLPKNITSVGDRAFDGCYNLSDISTDGQTITFGSSVFSRTKFYDDATNWESDGRLLHLDNNLLKAKNFTGEYIPEDWICSIAADAFTECSVSDITISKNIIKIGEALGRDFDTIKVDAANPVYDSRNNCNAVVETATNTLVFGCSQTVIPNTVTAIGSNAFSGCRFTEFSIPNSIIIIGDSAFRNCTNLTNITIPDSVTSIGGWAFEGCSNLMNVVVGNVTENIGEYAFANCVNLISVTIPKSIKIIGGYAFDGYASKLSTVNYLGTTDEWKSFYYNRQQQYSYDIMPTGTIIQCTNGTVTYIPQYDL